VRIAGTDRDGAGVDIAVIDVPAFLAGFGISAAGEFGHALLKRGAPHAVVTESQSNPRLNVPSEEGNAPGQSSPLMSAPDKP